jgi:hypothetical protein
MDESGTRRIVAAGGGALARGIATEVNAADPARLEADLGG